MIGPHSEQEPPHVEHHARCPTVHRPAAHAGSRVHGDAEVVTWTDAGPRRRTYAEVGRRCAALAHALRGLGVTGDQRVATFMWNNAEHLEAYLAVPSMGAVLHTLNIRLFPEQLIHVANHAEDHVDHRRRLADPVALPAAVQLTTVGHVVVAGACAAAWGARRRAGARLRGPDLRPPRSTTGPELDERGAAAMCYTSGTTGDPKGVVYSHRSIYLHSMQVCVGDGTGPPQGDRALTVVPQFHAMAWGLPYARVHGRRRR